MNYELGRTVKEAVVVRFTVLVRFILRGIIKHLNSTTLLPETTIHARRAITQSRNTNQYTQMLGVI